MTSEQVYNEWTGIQEQRHYPTLNTRERDLETKNENLQRYVTELLTRNATLNARVRELEGARR